MPLIFTMVPEFWGFPLSPTGRCLCAQPETIRRTLGSRIHLLRAAGVIFCRYFLQVLFTGQIWHTPKFRMRCAGDAPVRGHPKFIFKYYVILQIFTYFPHKYLSLRFLNKMLNIKYAISHEVCNSSTIFAMCQLIHCFENLNMNLKT